MLRTENVLLVIIRYDHLTLVNFFHFNSAEQSARVIIIKSRPCLNLRQQVCGRSPETIANTRVSSPPLYFNLNLHILLIEITDVKLRLIVESINEIAK